MCCGQKMEELVPNTTDAAVEKHVPVISVEGNRGHCQGQLRGAPHGGCALHQWIALETRQGNQRKPLHPGEKPEAVFALTDGDGSWPPMPTATCMDCGRARCKLKK